MTHTPVVHQPEIARNRIPWNEVLRNGTSILAVSGVLIYTILSVSYGQFYGALGVSANDVGLSYFAILASSVGAALALILVLLVATLILSITAMVFLFFIYLIRLILEKDFRDRISAGESGQIATILTALVDEAIKYLMAILREILDNFRKFLLLEARKYAVKITVWGVVIVTLMLAFYTLPRVANARALRVQNGYPISQPRLLPQVSLSLLAIRADPASIAATGEVGKTPALDELAVRTKSYPPLLYLGQANSTVVLYDSVKDEAIYVPSSSLVLKVANCKAQPTPPNC